MDAFRLLNRLHISTALVWTAAGDIVAKDNGVIIVKKTSGAATQVTLPARSGRGTFAFVKDGKGDAATNAITIIPDGTTNNTTIDGGANFVLNVNYGAAIFLHNGTEWGLIGILDPQLSLAELQVLDGVVAGTASASKAVVLDASKNITALGSVISTAPTGGGIGYGTGAGGAVTQITNRSTGVTLSKLTGAITTRTDSLAGLAAATFVVTNTTVAIGDTVVLSIQSGSNGGNTNAYVSTVTNGSFSITVANGNAAAGTAETGAIIINFAVVKAVAA